MIQNLSELNLRQNYSIVIFRDAGYSCICLKNGCVSPANEEQKFTLSEHGKYYICQLLLMGKMQPEKYTPFR